MKKGFTLIELLAVIVILAIIALIATPLIMDVIEKSRKGAFTTSGYSIIKAAELASLENDTIKEIEFTYRDNGVEESSIEGIALNYKGTKPKTGKVIVNDGNVSLALHNGKYCIKKGYLETEIKVTEESEGECTPLPFQDSSRAAVPEVSDGMIPITWDGSKWIKADIAKEWYNYNDKKWANVVLVTESSRSGYQTGNPGIEILEDDVLAYLVWIPRYRYQLFNVESELIDPISIQITFEDKTTQKSDGMVDGVHTNGQWYTHPAFTFGDDELNGFWMGKFETTGTGIEPTIKPGVASLRGRVNRTLFLASQMFSTTNNYGLTLENDSHMIKNTEWGAVAYLSHSSYGKNEEIWINPASSYQTGCAGETQVSTHIPICYNNYKTIKGQESSTTGNIYGVYDTSGGSWDRVMGNYNEIIATSGFVQMPEDKYYDKYDGTNISDRVLGDATSETRGWYGDSQSFVTSAKPWFLRGGTFNITNGSGVFSFISSTGEAHPNASFRIVILGGN